MYTQHEQYVLLFLVLAVNADYFQIFTELHALTLAARSYETLETLRIIIKYSHRPHSGGCVGGGK